MDSHRLTRDELYARVWATPMMALSKEYGVSDVALAKHCKKHNIPRPPRGYWAKKAVGKAPDRPPLPQDEGADEIVIGDGRTEPEPAEPAPPAQPFDPDIVAMLEAAKALPEIHASDSLHHMHPLVAAAKNRREERKKPDFTWEHERRDPTIAIEVSEEYFGWGLRLMDAFIKAIEQVGGSVRIARDEDRWKPRTSTMVSFGGEDVASVRLREICRRKQDGEERSTWPSYDLVPCGKFVLDSGPSWDQKAFCRGSDDTLAAKLNWVLIKFVELAGKQRIEERERAHQEKLEAARERRRKAKIAKLRREHNELLRKQRAEQSKVRELLKNASDFNLAQTLRTYIEVVAQRHRRDPQTNMWLVWAREQADRLDPLTPSPPSILDEPLPKVPKE